MRPDSYVEINNFYTMTVYNKGAEVIRMLRTLLGPDGFRKGTDLYFSRHDDQAVTTDDFVKAMEDATGADLKQFRLWYTQAGTPELRGDPCLRRKDQDLPAGDQADPFPRRRASRSRNPCTYRSPSASWEGTARNFPCS